jgi:hypothetical protein
VAPGALAGKNQFGLAIFGFAYGWAYPSGVVLFRVPGFGRSGEPRREQENTAKHGECG